MNDQNALVAAVIASVLSVVFFVQQQRLAEMRLFKELTLEFTNRYDTLNETLEQGVRRGHVEGVEWKAALDYFNLCAEEFLFYSEGYIDDRVWRAWCRGMLHYLESPAFRDLWSEQKRPTRTTG